MGIKSFDVPELKAIVMMVMVQMATAGQNILYKLAANDGMDVRVLVAYRLTFAAAFMVPLALYVERKRRPKMTWMVLCQGFFGGLFGGSLSQNLYAKSLVMTSPTFASAMTNIIPAFTFILAVLFRLERLNLGTMAGKAKVVGTLMSIGGAMLLTLYKGAVLNIWSTGVNLLNLSGHVATSNGESNNFVLGCLLLILACFFAAVALIFQTKMSKAYPCHYSSTALMAVMGSIQAVIFALITEREWDQWKLGLNVRLLTVSYAGIVASGIMIIFTMWCVHKKGPLFASIFSPLVLVIVAIVGSLVLDEKLHLGSVIGAVIIVCGLYVVLWGKCKETKNIIEVMPLKSSNEAKCIQIVVSSSPSSAENYKKSNSCKTSKVVPVKPPTSDDDLPVQN